MAAKESAEAKRLELLTRQDEQADDVRMDQSTLLIISVVSAVLVTSLLCAVIFLCCVVSKQKRAARAAEESQRRWSKATDLASEACTMET